MTPGVDLRPWLKIKARFEAGEKVAYGVRKLAEAALGERFVRLGQGARPDAQDRAAGDDSFTDDAGVALL